MVGVPWDALQGVEASVVDHDDTQTQTNALDHPDVAAHLSEHLLGILRRIDDGDEAARADALGPAAAIVDALAASGLLEFAYLAPSDDDDDDEGPIAWIAASDVLEVFDGPITLEDPPEHEDEA